MPNTLGGGSLSSGGSAEQTQPAGELAKKYGKQYGVDPLALQAMMQVESSDNPNAISSKGAMGLMQIMPTTAEQYASQLGIPGGYNLLDPDTNVHFGAGIMGQLLRKHPQLAQALLAYHSGTTRMPANPGPEGAGYPDKVMQILQGLQGGGGGMGGGMPPQPSDSSPGGGMQQAAWGGAVPPGLGGLATMMGMSGPPQAPGMLNMPFTGMPASSNMPPPAGPNRTPQGGSNFHPQLVQQDPAMGMGAPQAWGAPPPAQLGNQAPPSMYDPSMFQGQGGQMPQGAPPRQEDQGGNVPPEVSDILGGYANQQSFQYGEPPPEGMDQQGMGGGGMQQGMQQQHPMAPLLAAHRAAGFLKGMDPRAAALFGASIAGGFLNPKAGAQYSQMYQDEKLKRDQMAQAQQQHTEDRNARMQDWQARRESAKEDRDSKRWESLNAQLARWGVDAAPAYDERSYQQALGKMQQEMGDRYKNESKRKDEMAALRTRAANLSDKARKLATARGGAEWITTVKHIDKLNSLLESIDVDYASLNKTGNDYTTNYKELQRQKMLTQTRLDAEEAHLKRLEKGEATPGYAEEEPAAGETQAAPPAQGGKSYQDMVKELAGGSL